MLIFSQQGFLVFVGLRAQKSFRQQRKRLDLEGYQCEILDSESNSPSLKVNSLDPDLQDFIEFKATSPYSWLVCRKFGSLSQQVDWKIMNTILKKIIFIMCLGASLFFIENIFFDGSGFKFYHHLINGMLCVIILETISKRKLGKQINSQIEKIERETCS